MPAIKIYDKLTSLRYIFLYQVWLFTRPKFSRKFIQRADVLHTVCFPALRFPSYDLCKMCGRPMQEFFPRSTLHAWIFFSLNFPLHEFFFVPRPPPHNFSNGPSLNDSFSLLQMKFSWFDNFFKCYFYLPRHVQIPSQDQDF